MADDLLKSIVNNVLSGRKKLVVDEKKIAADTIRKQQNPGLEIGVKTLEGDTVDVQHAGMVPKVAGMIRGRPVMGKEYVPSKEKSAGFVPQIKVGFTHDTEAKKRIYAKARGIDPNLYRTLPSGELIYPGKDGVYHLETPKTTAAAVKKVGGQLVSDAPVMALETVGAVVGGVPGAAIGAMGGEVVKRVVARKAFGERQTVLDDYVLRPINTGVVSTVAGVTGKLAGPAVEGVNKVRRGIQGTGQLGRVVKNREVIQPAETLARLRRAEKFGIELDTARATQSDMLGAVHRDLGATSSPAGRIIRSSEARTQGQVRRALEEGRGGLPKLTRETTEPGKALVKGARDIEIGIRAARRNQASRLYKQAFKEAKGKDIDTSFVRGTIEEKMKVASPETKAELQKIYDQLLPPRDIALKGGKRAIERPGPITNIERLDQIQKSIRIRAKQLSEHGPDQNKNVAEELSTVRQTLLDAIGEVSPAYKAATQAYKFRTRALEKFEGDFQKSLLNKLSKVEGDYVHKAPGLLFGAESSPQLIAKTKAAFLSGKMKWKGRAVGGAEGEKMWGSIKKGALSDTIETLDQTLDIPQATMDKLQATLTAKEFEAFKTFKKVLEDIKYIPWSKRGPSAGQGAKILQEEVSGGAKILRRLTPSPYIQARELERIVISKRAPMIAKELTSGDGIRKIMKLKQISPDTKEFVKILSGILGSSLGRVAMARVRED